MENLAVSFEVLFVFVSSGYFGFFLSNEVGSDVVQGSRSPWCCLEQQSPRASEPAQTAQGCTGHIQTLAVAASGPTKIFR